MGDLQSRLVVPIFQKTTPGYYRAFMEAWDGDRWDELWPDSAILMGIAHCLTGMDISYRGHKATGMFAVNGEVWGKKDCPTLPGDVRVDPQLMIAIQKNFGTGSVENSWGALMLAQHWMFSGEGGWWVNYDWPDPVETVWAENIQAGMGLISLPSVSYAQPPQAWKESSSLETVRFELDGAELDEIDQATLWTLAFKTAIYAQAWWNPVKVRQAIVAALKFSNSDGQTLDAATYSQACAAMGDAAFTAQFAELFGSAVGAIRREPAAFLTKRYLESILYVRNNTGVWAWVRRVGHVTEDILRDIADDGSSWFDVLKWGGLAVLLLVLYGYLKPKGGGGK